MFAIQGRSRSWTFARARVQSVVPCSLIGPTRSIADEDVGETSASDSCAKACGPPFRRSIDVKASLKSKPLDGP